MPLTDYEMALRLRQIGSVDFERLAALLGGDKAAIRAMREETKFIDAHPHLPRSAEFAAKVRNYLVAQKLAWNQDNLEIAVAAVQIKGNAEDYD
jgi:hypothetical protein